MCTVPPAPITLDRRLLAFVAGVTALAGIYGLRVADADLWGHLLYGQLFLDQGGRIGTDPFAYTSAGRQWSTHEYLSQMILALAYSLGGPPGLNVLKCLVGGVAVACLWGCVRLQTRDARVWAPLLILTALALARWFQFRPQLFTYALFAAFVLCLFRYLVGRPAWLWLLPLALPLWVNLHGGFLAGIGAVGLALLLRLLQSLYQHGPRLAALALAGWPLLATLAACLAASLINPLGWRLWPYLATELSFAPNRRYIQEWQPILFDADQVWSLSLLVLTLVFLLFTGLLVQIKGERIAHLPAWVWLLSCLPLGVMAFQSIRHVPIFTIWSAAVLGVLAPAARAAWKDRRIWDLGWMGLSGLVALPALFTVVFVARDIRPEISTRNQPLGPRQPFGVAGYLKANQIQGRLYTPLWWGSYFSWELYPDILVSCDGRNVTLFAPQTVADNLSFYHEGNPDLDIPVNENADLLVVPRDAPVFKQVRDDTRWESLYGDTDVVLFVRQEGRCAGLLDPNVKLTVPVPVPTEVFPWRRER